jgi:hypothetical protein
VSVMGIEDRAIDLKSTPVFQLGALLRMPPQLPQSSEQSLKKILTSSHRSNPSTNGPPASAEPPFW